MDRCVSCPRACGADRDAHRGYCGQTNALRIARAALHMWEEPCISGERGSGTVFFSGCNLGCVFCQNYRVSHRGQGIEIGADELIGKMLDLQQQGAHNINLVTPTHYAEQLVPILARIKPMLHIPIAYNTGGYEKTETLELLAPYVDIWMPDFKFGSAQIAKDYAGAADYPEVAARAIAKMYEMAGKVQFDADGMMQRGVLVRHLVLPGCRKDSMAVLDRLAGIVPVPDVRLSLMSQYTPEFATDAPFANLHRRVTSFEYESVMAHAEKLGFIGYMQQRESATAKYTPEFEGEDVKI
ncbi:MAG: radical SAM protein [Clostridia bacterium]|nr:radical SAM protein [Clostridia bacterium]